MKIKEYYYTIKILESVPTDPPFAQIKTWRGRVFAYTKREAKRMLRDYFAEDGIIDYLMFSTIHTIKSRVDNAKCVSIDYI